MKRIRKTYSIFQLASAVFMVLALLWLTVSAPFVNASQQERLRQHKMENTGSPLSASEEESANPFGNSTEEKASGGSNTFSEEYLHDHHTLDHFFSLISRDYKREKAGTYIAFHGELLVPPPNAS